MMNIELDNDYEKWLRSRYWASAAAAEMPSTV